MNDKEEKSPSKRNMPSTPWSDWVMLHRKALSFACALCLLVLIGGVWMMQARKAREIKDFETADILANELQKSSPLAGDDPSTDPHGPASDQALAQLQDLDNVYTLLQPRFDGLIAEELLVREKRKEIDPYAKRTIARLRTLGLTDFADFSEVSRLSALHQYPDALKKATDLQKRMAGKRDQPNSTTSHEFLLEAFLLLHIASLNQKLSNHEAMLQTIFELKEYLGLAERKTPLTAKEKELASEVVAMLQEKQTSLLDFIAEMPKNIPN